MKDLAALHAAALELARASQLPSSEVAQRLEQVRNQQYWEGLSPAIEIGRRTALDHVAIAPEVQAGYEKFFSDEGYFETPALLPSSTIQHLNEIVDAVTAAGWPAVFALVSDAFWLVPRTPTLRHLVESRLGPDARQIPHFWLHIVRAIDGAGGWQPHFDGLKSSRMSTWLALTDASVTNGCMFLVPPRSLPPSFRTLKVEALKTVHVLRAMHATRALPIPAGASVGWDFDVFHWGGRAVRGGGERRALSMEFVAAGEPPDDDEVPLLSLDDPLPSLATRLKIIGIGLGTYSKFEPMSARFQSLSPDLVKLG